MKSATATLVIGGAVLLGAAIILWPRRALASTQLGAAAEAIATGTNRGAAAIQIGPRLLPAQRLLVGQQLVPNASGYLEMQVDGNLVVYAAPRTALWASGTSGQPAAYAEFQTDGNFVVYTADRRALWATGTDNKGAAYIEMQVDGNLVIYTASGTPLWSSQTYGWHKQQSGGFLGDLFASIPTIIEVGKTIGTVAAG